VVKAMYFDEPPQGAPAPRANKPLRWMLGVNALSLVVLGLAWNPIMAWCQAAFTG
jgi:NADH-quinone oxidoreductase subunit N